MRNGILAAGRLVGAALVTVAVFGLLSGIGLGLAGNTEVVSVSSAGFQGSNWARGPSASAGGELIAFHSYAADLVTGDTNGEVDLFVHDRDTGATSRISVSTSGDEADGSSFDASVAAPGHRVAFSSGASNLVPGDTNGLSDIFVRDLTTDATGRASVTSTGAEANGPSADPAISADGLHVAFQSYADNLVSDDTNGNADIFVRSANGTTTRVSVDSAGFEADDSSFSPTITANGRYVAFSSNSDKLVSGDVNGRADIFVYDRLSKETELVSVSSGRDAADADSFDPSISADGRYVAFDSLATNLVVGDSNGEQDVFVHDRDTGETTLVSVSSSGGAGDDSSIGPSISADGRYVAFTSWASTFLNFDDNGPFGDVFVHDRYSGATLLASRSTAGSQGNDASVEPAISADGQVVAFASYATNLITDDTTSEEDIYVHEVVYPVPPTTTSTTSATATPSTTPPVPNDGCQGTFTDTVGHLFEGDSACIAEAGITKGCNPPLNDRFCPDDRVTRGQMAAFLVRGLDLDPAPDQGMTDTTGSVFRADVDALAYEGITRGCNPPTNDRFCPDDYVTRGQMAAFITRALELPPASTDSFVDDDGSVFESDIAALAAAGVTKGCNPPLNDRYCPNDYVTRGQMAAFLNRSVVPAMAQRKGARR